MGYYLIFQQREEVLKIFIISLIFHEHWTVPCSVFECCKKWMNCMSKKKTGSHGVKSHSWKTGSHKTIRFYCCVFRSWNFLDNWEKNKYQLVWFRLINDLISKLFCTLRSKWKSDANHQVYFGCWLPKREDTHYPLSLWGQ